MKKIEHEFVQEFDKSLGNQKTFEDIKDKINITRFQKKKTSSHTPLNKIFTVVASFVLVIAITIPSVIFIWHASNVVDPGLDNIPSIGGKPSTDENPAGGDPSTGNNPSNNPSPDGNPSTGENPSGGDSSTGNNPSPGENHSEGDNSDPSSGGEDENLTGIATVVRTKLNTGMGAPSLPHFVSAETLKFHSVTDTTIDVNVYLGHDFYNDIIAFSEFVLSKDELKNYTFEIAINYNNEQTAIVLNNVDYANSLYDVKVSDLYEDDVYMGSVVHYNKYHTVSLDTQLLTNKTYGFINVQLMIKSLQDGSESIVMNTTLYYSVTQQQIIFGLRENPVLHEGDDGAITCGWEYKG